MSKEWTIQEILKLAKEDEADELKDKIVKQFGKFNCNISISKWDWLNDKFIFRVKTKGNTREAHIRANAEDVRLRLKIPLLQVRREDNYLLIIAATEKLKYPQLLTVLRNSKVQEWTNKVQLHYIVGHNTLGDLELHDLSRFPHLLMGGATGSGKTVGLHALISTIALTKYPSEVNFILIDVGTSDLMFFDKLPHLSCPVIRKRDLVLPVLSALLAELDRRAEMEHSDHTAWMNLPKIVLIIDEFPELFKGELNKDSEQSLKSMISTFLGRGRHGHIHLVFTAQNPTFQNMKVDLGNIRARAAFQCAKANFSQTIIGDDSAEKLKGNGEMMFKAPNKSKAQFIQGINVSREIIPKIVDAAQQYMTQSTNKFVIQLPESSSVGTGGFERLTDSVKVSNTHSEDKMFAHVLLEAFASDQLSGNTLTKVFHIGWNAAKKFMDKLTDLGVISEPRGKSPRKVIPEDMSQLPDELISFLNNHGIDKEAIITAFQKRCGDDSPNDPSEKSTASLERTGLATSNKIKNGTLSNSEIESEVAVDSAIIDSGDKHSDLELDSPARIVKVLFGDVPPTSKAPAVHKKKRRSYHIKDSLRLYCFTNAITWTLSQHEVSRLQLQMRLNKDGGMFDGLISRMKVWGIITQITDSPTWKVLPNSVDDLSDEAKEYLLSQGQTEDSLKSIFEQKVS